MAYSKPTTSPSSKPSRDKQDKATATNSSCRSYVKTIASRIYSLRFSQDTHPTNSSITTTKTADSKQPPQLPRALSTLDSASTVSAKTMAHPDIARARTASKEKDTQVPRTNTSVHPDHATPTSGAWTIPQSQSCAGTHYTNDQHMPAYDAPLSDLHTNQGSLSLFRDPNDRGQSSFPGYARSSFQEPIFSEMPCSLAYGRASFISPDGIKCNQAAPVTVGRRSSSDSSLRGPAANTASLRSSGSKESVQDLGALFNRASVTSSTGDSTQTTEKTALISKTNVPTRQGPTLLSLPYDIRRMIYLKVPYLKMDRPLVYCTSIFDGRKHHSLSGICRQIRVETSEIYYSSNEFLIKTEYPMFYESFVEWINSLDSYNVQALRLLRLSLRGNLFYKPGILPRTDDMKLERMCSRAEYGYATYSIDLSEKHENGKVEIVSCIGGRDVAEKLKKILEVHVKGLWEKKNNGEMMAEDVKKVVDEMLEICDWWTVH